MHFHNLLSFVFLAYMNIEDAKNGVPIGPRVSLNLVTDIHYI